MLRLSDKEAAKFLGNHFGMTVTVGGARVARRTVIESGELDALHVW